ncbi:MAG: hypothetical protein R3F31_06835 [Verrucomicrobiales bacterium]
MEIADRQRLVTYLLEIGQEAGKPIVRREILRYKRGRHGFAFFISSTLRMGAEPR